MRVIAGVVQGCKRPVRAPDSLRSQHPPLCLTLLCPKFALASYPRCPVDPCSRASVLPKLHSTAKTHIVRRAQLLSALATWQAQIEGSNAVSQIGAVMGGQSLFAELCSRRKLLIVTAFQPMIYFSLIEMSTDLLLLFFCSACKLPAVLVGN